MFRKVILGYQYSPSLGDELLSFEQKLRKKLRWQIAVVFALLFTLFTIFLTSIVQVPNIKHTSLPLIKIDSTEKLALSAKTIYQPEVIKPNSQIIIRLTAKNKTTENLDFNFKFQSSDILEYGAIEPQTDLTINKDYSFWNNSIIQPGETATRQFTIKVNHIPLQKNDANHKNSYDCKMSLFFGNEISHLVACPIVKKIENSIFTAGVITLNHAYIILSVLLFVAAGSAVRTNLLLSQIKAIKRST